MNTVTVSPKFQVVIPKQVREQLNIQPGQKVQVLVYQGQIMLVPILPMAAARGIARGIETDVPREPDRV